VTGTIEKSGKYMDEVDHTVCIVVAGCSRCTVTISSIREVTRQQSSNAFIYGLALNADEHMDVQQLTPLLQRIHSIDT
jgi:hypothetical protein